MIDDIVIEQISHFEYLGCDVIYEKDQDINQKVQTFEDICGTVRRPVNGGRRQDTQLRFYSFIPVLMYDRKLRAITEQSRKQISSSRNAFSKTSQMIQK